MPKSHKIQTIATVTAVGLELRDLSRWSTGKILYAIAAFGFLSTRSVEWVWAEMIGKMPPDNEYLRLFAKETQSTERVYGYYIKVCFDYAKRL